MGETVSTNHSLADKPLDELEERVEQAELFYHDVVDFAERAVDELVTDTHYIGKSTYPARVQRELKDFYDFDLLYESQIQEDLPDAVDPAMELGKGEEAVRIWFEGSERLAIRYDPEEDKIVEAEKNWEGCVWEDALRDVLDNQEEFFEEYRREQEEKRREEARQQRERERRRELMERLDELDVADEDVAA